LFIGLFVYYIMITFFDRLFRRYPIKSQRFLEILPGLTAWLLIFMPVYGSFLFPEPLAYFILFFDVYWCYKSFHLVYTSHKAHGKIKAAEKQDWLAKATKLDHFDK